jgi:hypothetical protein
LILRHKKHGTAELHQKLMDKLHIERLCFRTTQRDLVWLEAHHYAARLEEADKRSKKHDYWYLTGRQVTLRISPNDAMNLHMIFEHAQRFGVAHQVAQLGESECYAKAVMIDSRDLLSSQRVTSATRFMALHPAQIKPGVLENS